MPGIARAAACNGSARDRHNSAQCSCTNLLGTGACRSTPGGRSRPSCSSRSPPTSGSTSGAGASRAPRAARARRRSGGSCCGSPASLCLFVALVSPVDRLGEQFASVHMVQHLLLADLVADLPDAGADQAHPAAGHAPDPADRARGGAVRAPGVRRRRLRRRDVALAHPGALRGRARALVRPRARAPDVRRRRAPVLVAPALADPLAAAARRPRPGALHGARRRSSSASSASCSRSRRTSSTTSTRPARQHALGPVAARRPARRRA